VTVNVQLGEIACSGLEGHFGPDISAGTRRAMIHYAYKLKAGRRPPAVPGFLDDPPEPQAVFDLTLDKDSEDALAREALRQQVSLTRLVAHAVLVYLAELEFLGVAPRGTADGTRLF
jgi:hypothetical protein